MNSLQRLSDWLSNVLGGDAKRRASDMGYQQALGAMPIFILLEPSTTTTLYRPMPRTLMGLRTMSCAAPNTTSMPIIVSILPVKPRSSE